MADKKRSFSSNGPRSTHHIRSSLTLDGTGDDLVTAIPAKAGYTVEVYYMELDFEDDSTMNTGMAVATPLKIMSSASNDILWSRYRNLAGPISIGGLTGIGCCPLFISDESEGIVVGLSTLSSDEIFTMVAVYSYVKNN